MLSLDACRRLVGPKAQDMSDSEVGRLRDALTDIARLAVSSYKAQTRVNEPSDGRLDGDERIELEERAAVLEFDANLPREQALRTAEAEHRRRRAD